MANLGDKVRDSVSGFQGVVVAKTMYLNGCTRVGVQPRIGKDGKHPDSATFDEPQLELLKVGAVKTGRRDTGGPAPYRVTQNETLKR